MSVFQNAKIYPNQYSGSLDICISIKLVHFKFDRVFLNVPFVIRSLYQLETCSQEYQFSKTPKFIQIPPAILKIFAF